MPKDRSCEATIYPFVGRARAAALGAPSANVLFWTYPKGMNAGCREREVPKCGCPGGKGFANEAIFASRVRNSEGPNRSAWGN